MAQQGYGNQTWPTEYLPLLVKYLGVDAGIAGLKEDRVFLSVWDDKTLLLFPPADRFVAISQPNFPVDQQDVLGGGAINTPFDSELLVRVFVRVESSIEGRSTQVLTDDVLGLFKFLQDILTAFQMWTGPIATVAPTRSLFRRPLRIAPGFTIESKDGGADSRWALAKMRYELSFVSNLGQNYPGG